MKFHPAIYPLFFTAITSFGADNNSKANDDQVAWLEKQDTSTPKNIIPFMEKCLFDFSTIKVGVTRATLENQFKTNSAYSPTNVTFIHPQCSYFHIDVEFQVKRDPAEQNRAILGKDDKVIHVSKPYIERAGWD